MAISIEQWMFYGGLGLMMLWWRLPKLWICLKFLWRLQGGLITNLGQWRMFLMQWQTRKRLNLMQKLKDISWKDCWVIYNELSPGLRASLMPPFFLHFWFTIIHWFVFQTSWRKMVFMSYVCNIYIWERHGLYVYQLWGTHQKTANWQ